jgi:methyl-accepting chemotaxis protein
MASFARASVRQRLLLLMMLCFVACALPTLMLARSHAEEIRMTSRMVAGVDPARNLIKVIQLAQQHRGLSAVWLGGDESAAERRAAKKKEVDAALAELQARLQADGATASRLGKAYARHTESWHKLEALVAGKQIDGTKSSAEHTHFIAGLLAALDEAADHWELSFTPQPDIYFLVMAALRDAPAMIELMGQTRARGATLLSSKEGITEVDRVRFESLQARMRQVYSEMSRTLEKSVAVNQRGQDSVQAVAQRLGELGQTGIKIAQDNVLAAERTGMTPADYFKQTTQVIDGMYEALSSGLTLMEKGLKADLAARWRAGALVLGGVLAALLAAVAYTLATTRRIRRDLGAEPSELCAAAQRVRDGDLATPVALGAAVQPGSVLAMLGEMQKSLADTVQQVRMNAESVSNASSEIATGNHELSSRTEQQASAVQVTASTMEELGSTVRNNADNSRQADQLARQASNVATEGGAVVTQVVQTMKGINESSRRISEIIGVIDGIAFQTNILALNAAVEAARAGEQGRGFAVVASEVRSLAQRSADAAREIKSLISASVERVETGSQQAEQAGRTMEQVVQAIRRVTDIMGEISQASQEQSSGVQQVGSAVNQLDQGTQQNAALVEQTAAAAQSLQQQAGELVRLVSVFKVGAAA